MGYNTLIDRNLVKAFNLAKDQAVSATLVRKSNLDFNFSSGEASSTDTSLPIKVIIIEKEQESKEHNAVKQTVMMKSKEIGALTQHDELQLGGVTWSIGPKIKDSGIIYVVEVFKES
jgi:hypothetical protein